MLRETSVIDSINVRDTGHIEVRRSDIITRKKDGKTEEVSRTYHRHVIEPQSDLSREDPRVAAVARAAWKFDTGA